MNAEEKLRRLIAALTTKTDAGQLVWREAVDGLTFKTSLGNSFLFVTRYEVEDDGRLWNRYEFSVTDGEYRVLESATRDLHSDGEVDDVANLYTTARRSARGSGQVLDELLATLEAA